LQKVVNRLEISSLPEIECREDLLDLEGWNKDTLDAKRSRRHFAEHRRDRNRSFKLRDSKVRRRSSVALASKARRQQASYPDRSKLCHVAYQDCNSEDYDRDSCDYCDSDYDYHRNDRDSDSCDYDYDRYHNEDDRRAQESLRRRKTRGTGVSFLFAES